MNPGFIGNDIVDLKLCQSSHPRFAARVLAEQEYQCYQASGFSERLLWRHWAAKEAAYKVAKQGDPGKSFSPRCFIFDPLTKCVSHGDQRYSLLLEEGSDFVSATALLNVVFWQQRRCVLRAEPSREVRELALSLAAETLGLELASLSITNDACNIPWISTSGKILSHCRLSLSHDGRFGAAAIAYTPAAND